MESTLESKSEKPEKSYLSVAVDSISPWGSSSRSSTPKPTSATATGGSGLKSGGGDHITQYWHGLSQKRYPPDSPPINARWYYAVDVRRTIGFMRRQLTSPSDSETQAKTAKDAHHRRR
jgi:hypothetical protein